MSSIEVMCQLQALGLSDGELATRAGVARETVGRWRSGSQKPSLDALESLASAAGARLVVQVVPADAEHVALVCDQLDLGPTERLKVLLGDAWPSAREALRAAAALGDLAVVVGPMAAALSGAPQRPGDGRVDVLIAPADGPQAFEALLAAGVRLEGVEASAGDRERRERWRSGRGVMTVRTTGAVLIDEVRRRARPVMLNADGVGIVHLPLVEDLLDIATASPWSEDAVTLPGLRAVLASGRYSSRDARAA